jgi:hypothetical protein
LSLLKAATIAILSYIIIDNFQKMRQLIQTLYTHKKSRTLPEVNQ